MKIETSGPTREKVIAVNRKAYHDYHIEAKVEAGLVLTGSEIKSIRAGKVNIRDAYARIEKGEAWLLNAHISTYKEAGQYFGHEPLRPRKLLLHSNEIGHLLGKMQTKGLTLIPLKLYLKRGRAKVELGLARGKKLYDKREAIAERESQREVERELKYR